MLTCYQVTTFFQATCMLVSGCDAYDAITYFRQSLFYSAVIFYLEKVRVEIYMCTEFTYSKGPLESGRFTVCFLSAQEIENHLAFLHQQYYFTIAK